MFMFCALVSNAQKTENHIENLECDRVVGTWEWKSGDTSVVIKLKKEVMFIDDPVIPDNGSIDVLVGYHSFKIGNTVLQSSLSDYSAPIDFNTNNNKLQYWL